METLTLERKAEIADAVVGALKYATASDGYRRCGYYAHAGAEVLNRLGPGAGYRPVYRRFHFKVAWNEGDGLKDYVFGRYSSFKSVYKYIEPAYTDHCYIVRDDEVVDFSTHMHSTYFERRFGIRWDFSPPFFWDTRANVPKGYEDWFDTILVEDADPKGFLPGEYDRLVTREIVDEAMWRLDGRPAYKPVEPWRIWGFRLNG